MIWRNKFKTLKYLWGAEHLETENKYDVAYLVRGKNEGRWIGAFLSSLESQVDIDRSLLIFLDSGSTDDTVTHVKNYKRDSCCLSIDPVEFSFGDTCNLLIELSPANLVVFMSAHIYISDVNVISRGCQYFDEGNIAGVSFRQIEHHLIGASKYEKLYLQRKFPVRDSISSVETHGAFSNAASIVRKSEWIKSPFSSVVASEDDIWAKTILARGLKIIYLPHLMVEHSHNERPIDVYHRVRINKVARYGDSPRPLKAAIFFLAVFVLLLVHQESFAKSLRFSLAHSLAYVARKCPLFFKKFIENGAVNNEN
jgi:glycosyltransferase involved in cell wall biosynthesis